MPCPGVSLLQTETSVQCEPNSSFNSGGQGLVSAMRKVIEAVYPRRQTRMYAGIQVELVKTFFGTRDFALYLQPFLIF